METPPPPSTSVVDASVVATTDSQLESAAAMTLLELRTGSTTTTTDSCRIGLGPMRVPDREVHTSVQPTHCTNSEINDTTEIWSQIDETSMLNADMTVALQFDADAVNSPTQPADFSLVTMCITLSWTYLVAMDYRVNDSVMIALCEAFALAFLCSWFACCFLA